MVAEHGNANTSTKKQDKIQREIGKAHLSDKRKKKCNDNIIVHIQAIRNLA